MPGRTTAGRRSFLRTVGALGGGFAIAGCADSDDDSGSSTATPTPVGNDQLRTELGVEYPDYQLEDELTVYQWTNYWHPNTVPDFEDAFGVSVSSSLYGSNEELYATLQNEGLDAYDVIFPSDWMVSKLIREEKIRALDVSKLGNWENLGDRWIENAPYDRGGERHSVPYLWGTTGIAWHEEMVDGSLDGIDHLDSWDAMWNEAYEGQIQMMDLPRETYTAALKRLGYSLNTTDSDEIQEATELLVQQKELLARYKGSQVTDDLVNKRATPMHAFSGDAIQASLQLEENETSPIKYRIPREGGVVWLDAMAIPRDSPHPNAAHAFIDYMLNRTVGAQNANFTFYATPNETAMADVQDEILSDPAIFPPEDTLEKLEFIQDVGDALSHYEDGWETVQNA